jgi:hypothetical protein
MASSQVSISRARRASLVVLSAFVLLGCGGDTPAADGEATNLDTAPGPAAAATPRALTAVIEDVPAPGDSAAMAASVERPCALFGLWRPCSVIHRLESAGLGPVPYDGAVRQTGLDIAGSALRLGRGELQFYLYADSVSARAAAERLDPREAEPARARGILRPPTVIRSANLVALMFNNNDRQLERVQLAITAGLPAT